MFLVVGQLTVVHPGGSSGRDRNCAYAGHMRFYPNEVSAYAEYSRTTVLPRMERTYEVHAQEKNQC